MAIWKVKMTQFKYKIEMQGRSAISESYSAFCYLST
jgi:hypothetical protein